MTDDIDTVLAAAGEHEVTLTLDGGSLVFGLVVNADDAETITLLLRGDGDRLRIARTRIIAARQLGLATSAATKALRLEKARWGVDR